MSKKKKVARLCSLLLVLALMVSCVPVFALAQESDTTQETVDFLEYLDECVPVIFQNTDTIYLEQYLRMAYGLPEETVFSCEPASVEFMEFADGDRFSITLTARNGHTGTAVIEGEVRYMMPAFSYANTFRVTANMSTLANYNEVAGSYTFPKIDDMSSSEISKGTIRGLKVNTEYDLNLSLEEPSNYDYSFGTKTVSPALAVFRSDDGYTKADRYGAYTVTIPIDSWIGTSFTSDTRYLQLTLIFEGKSNGEGNRSTQVKPGTHTFTAPVQDDPSYYSFTWKKSGSSSTLSSSQSLTVAANANETYVCTIKRNNTKDIDGCLGSDGTWTYTVNVVPEVSFSVKGLTLAANGQPQELVDAQCVGGTVKFLYNQDGSLMSSKITDSRVYVWIESMADSVYQARIPTATEPGTYYLYYRVYPNEGYIGGLGSNTWNYVTAKIEKPKAAVTTVPTAITGLTYNGSAQSLVNAGTAQTTMLYSVTSNTVTAAPANGWSEIVPSKTDAGSYKVWYKAKAEGNYRDSDPGNVVVQINRKPVTVSGITAGDKIYDGTRTAQLNVNSAVISGKISADTLHVAMSGTFADKHAGNGKTVNIDTLELTGSDAGNYQLANTGNQITAIANITPKAVTATVSAQNKTYDGTTGAEVSATAETGISGESLDFSKIGGSFADSTPATSVSVSYTSADFTVSASSNTKISNYAVTYTPASGKVTADIRNAELTNVSVQQIGTMVYDGTSRTPEVDASAVAVNNQTVTFSYSMTENGTYSHQLPQFENAGEYTVWFRASAQYHDTATGSFKVKVEKNTVQTPTATLEKYYTGEALSADIPAGDLYTVSNNGGINAGKYPATLALKDPNNYKWSSTGNSENLNWQFTILQVTNSWIEKPAISGWLYGESGNDPAYTAKFGNDTVKVTYSGTTNTGAAYPESTIKPSQAGTYTAVFELAETANYTGLSSNAIFTIAARALDENSLTVSAESFVYNGTVQTPAVSVAGLAKDVDYTVTYLDSEGNLVEGPTLADTYTLVVTGKNNYCGSLNNKTFTISRRDLSLSADDQTVVYGEAVSCEPDMVTADALASGDAITSVTLTTSDLDVTTEGVIRIDAVTIKDGETDVTASYNITQKLPGTLTITPKPLTVSGITAPDKFYDGTTEVPLNYSNVQLNGIVGTQTLTVTATGTAAVKNVGTGIHVTISDIQLADGSGKAGNYTLSTGSQSSTTVNITKRILGVELDVSDISREYDASNAIDASLAEMAKISLTNVVQGEETLVLPNAVYSYDTKDVGSDKTVTAIVSLTGSGSSNYVLEKTEHMAPGAQITGFAVVVTPDSNQGKTYGDSEPAAYTYTLSRTLPANETLTAPLTRANGENAGTYAYQITEHSNNPNYTLTMVADAPAFTISPLTITETNAVITLGDNVLAYTDAQISYQPASIVVSLGNGTSETLAAEVDYTLSGNRATNVGTYILTVEGVGNYSGNLTRSWKIVPNLDVLDGLSIENVTSDSKESLEFLKESLENADDTNATAEEKQQWEEALRNAESLLLRIAVVEEVLHTDSIENTGSITKDNVALNQKEILEQAQKDYEHALSTYDDNMKESEKQSIREAIQRIEAALNAIANAQAVIDEIHNLPRQVKPDNLEAEAKILEVQKQYEALTEHEKKLADNATRNKLHNLISDLTDYQIIRGNKTKWTKGSGTNLVIVANGSCTKFAYLEIDGRKVSEHHYFLREGSTVITLKAAYLQNLRVGRHTIQVFYTDGQTDLGYFQIVTPSANPSTGDHILFAAAMLALSAAGLMMLGIGTKKKKV